MQAASLRDKIRGMNMKITTVLAISALALAGSACSESKTKTSPESADTVAVDSGSGGTLNLSLPSTISEADSSGGTLNLNLAGAGSEEPRLIGADEFNGVDFSSAPGPALAIEPGDAAADNEDDDIIRLQPN